MKFIKAMEGLKTVLGKYASLLIKRPESLTEPVDNRSQSADSQEHDQEHTLAIPISTVQDENQVETTAQETANAPFKQLVQQKLVHIARGTGQYIRIHRWTIVQGISTAAFIGALLVAGNQYVQLNMNKVYHVIVNGEDVGTVSNPEVVLAVEEAQKQEVQQKSDSVEMVLLEPAIQFTDEKAFKLAANDKEVVQKLPSYFTSYPVGQELKVDGKLIGVLKDKETVDSILDQIKGKFDSKKKEPGKVAILSASPAVEVEEVELQSIDFVQQVELNQIRIQPQDIMDPDEILKKLETGDVQPTKYTVEKGDCVSCIAKKFNISKQVIYENNPWIVDDMIKVGQQLDLTVLQPTLAVRTVEKVIESQEIQYTTEYQQDPTMRAGLTQVISPGKNGMKKVTVLLTKVNGYLVEEAVQDEEVLEEPVKAVAKRGTKVIQGEGTGKFAWPVVSASISSTFGTRWGVLHKGVDLTSGNKNILASDNGKVIYTGYKSDYGNHIIIDHLNGYKTLYGHLSAINTSVGKIVEKGEKIGLMGSTGDSTGVHLHFEIQKGKSPDNPMKYISR
jgi:murein DD-endopeptidase MepM/ murein hydrolase activator NlpD